MKKEKKKKGIYAKFYRGFSFVEGIVAVLVMTVGMIPVIKLMSSSTRQLIESKNQATAVLLSQEGVELVRNMRDNNWALGKTTFDSSTFPNANTGNCRIDYTSPYVDALPLSIPNMNCDNDATSKRLNYVETLNKTFSHLPGESSIFQRKISITYLHANGVTVLTRDDPNTAMAKINSMVVWLTGDNNFPPLANCTTARSCTYTELILTKWGE